ncbi:MAG: hypothetical protein WEE67_08840 [Chloroflexota bacterium]
MRSGGGLNWPDTVFFALLVIALAGYSVVIVSGEGDEPGRPDGFIVLGGALLLGLLAGSVVEISGVLRESQGRNPSKKARMTIALWLGATGLALLIRAYVPEVFGWSIGVVAPALLAGLVVPVLAGSLWRELRGGRA